MKKEQIKRMHKCIRKLLSQNSSRLSQKERNGLRQIKKYLKKTFRKKYSWQQTLQKILRSLKTPLGIVRLWIENINS